MHVQTQTITNQMGLPPASLKPVAKRISVTKVARIAGFHRSYVSEVLAGKRTPSIPAAKRIAIAAGIPLAKFLNRLAAV